MLLYPNRVGQSGTFSTGTPNYVTVPDNNPETGMVTFVTAATDESWSDDDTLGVLVIKDDDNWQVCVATWQNASFTLELDTLESSLGTLSDSDAVTVIATVTSGLLTELQDVATNAQFVADATTARTLAVGDHGKTVRCTSADAVAITCDDALPVGFHCLVVQEGEGAVSIGIEGTDTVNGGTTAIDVQQQWASAYVYQPAEGEWVVVA